MLVCVNYMVYLLSQLSTLLLYLFSLHRLTSSLQLSELIELDTVEIVHGSGHRKFIVSSSNRGHQRHTISDDLIARLKKHKILVKIERISNEAILAIPLQGDIEDNIDDDHFSSTVSISSNSNGRGI